MKITYYPRPALLGWAGVGFGAAGGRGVCGARYGGQSAGDGGGGAGEDIQIRSLEALTGIGELGVPRQRAVAIVLADYGPIEGHRVSMGAGLDSLCTAEGGAARAEAVDVYFSGLEFSFGGSVNGATGESGDEVYAA